MEKVRERHFLMANWIPEFYREKHVRKSAIIRTKKFPFMVIMNNEQ